MATSPTLAILHRSCATPTNRASQSGYSLRESYSRPKRWSRSRSREEARSQGSQKPEWLTQYSGFWLPWLLASSSLRSKVSRKIRQQNNKFFIRQGSSFVQHRIQRLGPFFRRREMLFYPFQVMTASALIQKDRFPRAIR